MKSLTFVLLAILLVGVLADDQRPSVASLYARDVIFNNGESADDFQSRGADQPNSVQLFLREELQARSANDGDNDGIVEARWASQQREPIEEQRRDYNGEFDTVLVKRDIVESPVQKRGTQSLKSPCTADEAGDSSCNSGYCGRTTKQCSPKKANGDKCYKTNNACTSAYCQLSTDLCAAKASNDGACEADGGCVSGNCVNRVCSATPASKAVTSPSNNNAAAAPKPSGSKKSRRKLFNLPRN